MISEETLEHFSAAVEHMREVHGRAVMLNMSALANWNRMRGETQWIIKGNYEEASDLSVRSTEVLRNATVCLINLQVAYENPLSDGWEVSVNASIRGLENCISEMGIIENELAEVYPEHIRDTLKDWLFEYHFQKAFVSEDKI